MAKVKRRYSDLDIEYWRKKLIINRLRQASRYWPAKNLTLAAAKIKVECGKHKNGNPKYQTKLKCNSCKQLFKQNEVNVDHKNPAIDVKLGFIDFNTYISRLFCETSNLQVLCYTCHGAKSLAENKIRKKVKQSRKKI